MRTRRIIPAMSRDFTGAMEPSVWILPALQGGFIVMYRKKRCMILPAG